MKWSKQEKATARRAFDAAYARESQALAAEIRQRAKDIADPAGIWELEDFLAKKRREIDRKYDYRYSQLIFVFGVLMREGWIRAGDLEGLADEKIDQITQVARFKCS